MTQATTLRPGLVSVTFRGKPAAEVARLAADAGLAGVEWGGDVHAPHGDLAAAREVRRATADAGLECAAYGSYYRLGHEADDGVPAWAAVLDSARELDTPLIRVWAGRKGSAQAGAADVGRVADDARRAVATAADAGLTVAVEWHGGTLTDTPASAAALLDAVPGLQTYWQPAQRRGVDERLAELATAAPRLAHVHAFHWTDGNDRRPLAEGAAEWRRYLAALPPGERFVLLEFVKGDDEAQFRADAATLVHLVRGP